MTTLVTGGTGFIGRYVAEELLRRGREVLILDRHYPSGSLIRGAGYNVADIRDQRAVSEAMSHADSWVHLAGVLGTQETISHPHVAAETNILGALNVLTAAARYELPGVNIAVGNWWMLNTYAISKRAAHSFAEMFVQERKLPVTTVRALNAYGPRQVPADPYGPSKVRKILPAFICRALTQAPIEIYGDGTQIMDMIHVRDVARIMATALEYTEQHGPAKHVVEAGTGRRTSVNTIAQTVMAECPAFKGSIQHVPMRPGEPESSKVIGDPSTLDLIGYEGDLTALEDGVAETVQWFLDHWLPRWRRGSSAPS